jgi:hypothetical protein
VENIEKAALLMQAADYTRSLQVPQGGVVACNALPVHEAEASAAPRVQAAMRQLLELQGQAKLPEVCCCALPHGAHLLHAPLHGPDQG